MICELKHAKNKSSFGDGNYLPKVVIDDEEEGGILVELMTLLELAFMEMKEEEDEVGKRLE